MCWRQVRFSDWNYILFCSRPDLMDNYQALVLSAFIKSGLLEVQSCLCADQPVSVCITLYLSFTGSCWGDNKQWWHHIHTCYHVGGRTPPYGTRSSLSPLVFHLRTEYTPEMVWFLCKPDFAPNRPTPSSLTVTATTYTAYPASWTWQPPLTSLRARECEYFLLGVLMLQQV